MRISGSGTVSVAQEAARTGSYGLHAFVPSPSHQSDEASVSIAHASPASGTYAMRERIYLGTPMDHFKHRAQSTQREPRVRDDDVVVAHQHLGCN